VSCIDELAAIAVDCGFHIHKELGPGLFENVYEAVLAEALIKEGLAVNRQQSVPISFVEFSWLKRSVQIWWSRILWSLRSSPSNEMPLCMPNSC
jgi:hypothetical protein